MGGKEKRFRYVTSWLWACSSVWQSIGLLSRGSRVQFPSGPLISVERMKKIDPTQHEIVPKHIVLEDEEVEALLKIYDITRDKLPLIKATDPIVKTINAKPGQVIKIIRKGSPAGEAVVYRLVVK